MKKTGQLTPEQQKIYDVICNSQDIQLENYRSYISRFSKNEIEGERKKCLDMKLKVDVDTGMLEYTCDFSPLDLSYDVCYVRHGKTEGNTEPRVYQGQVDYPENQLNSIGKKQAQEVAEKMKDFIESRGWMPDCIILSPLHRAIETGSFFFNNHKEIPTVICPQLVEMCFGSWDNIRIIDLPSDSMSHLFFLYQNALVRAPHPHVVTEKTRQGGFLVPGQQLPAENFIDVLARAKSALLSLQNNSIIQKCTAQGRRARVVFYGHSMIGAAISILLGQGKYTRVNHANRVCLGFDGTCLMPHTTPTLLCPIKPQILSSEDEV